MLSRHTLLGILSFSLGVLLLSTGSDAQTISGVTQGPLASDATASLRVTQILRSMPTQGQSGVPVGQPVAFFLSDSLQATTVNSTTITASAGGVSIATTIDLSVSRRVITLSFPGDLPQESTVEIALDGDSMLDDFDLAPDLDHDGQPGGSFLLSFQTGDTSPPIESGPMTVSGRVFAYVNGQATLLQGAQIDAVYFPTFDGAPTLPGPAASSGADGRFAYTTPEIAGMSELLVRVRFPGHTEALRQVTALANGCWEIQDAYLQPLAPATTVLVGQAATLMDPTGQIELIIPDDALIQDSDISITILEGAQSIRDDLPALTSQDGLFIDVAGVFGDQTNSPVTLCVPNTYGLPLGTQVPFGKIDHNTLEWIDMQDLAGPGENFVGEVVSDGQGGTEIQVQFTHFCTVCTGYCLNILQGLGLSGDDNGCGGSSGAGTSSGNSVVNRREGHLYEFLSLPSFREFGEEIHFGFGYYSAAANPEATLTGTVEYGNTRPVERTFFTFNVEGAQVEAAYGYSDNDLKQHGTYIWDGRNGLGQRVSTGSYPYTFEAASLNADTKVSVPSSFGGPATQVFPAISYPGLTTLPVGTVESRVALVNLEQSAFGAGWSFLSEARVHLMADGGLLLVEGNAEWLQYSPDPMTPGQWLAPGGDVSDVVFNGARAEFERRTPDGNLQVFNVDGRIVADIDRHGYSTDYTYSAGRLRLVTTPTGHWMRFVYGSGGKLTSVVDSAGRRTQFSVDGAGDLVAMTSASGVSRSFAYDAQHLLESQVKPSGAVTRYSYSDGRISEVDAFDSDGVTLLRHREFTPSILHGEIRTSLAQGIGSLNSPIPPVALWRDEMVDGRGFVSSSESNYLGQYLSETDGLQRVTRYEYDANQMPVRITAPDGSRAQMIYNSDGEVTSLRNYNGLGSQTSSATMQYDGPYGELSRLTNPVGKMTDFGYDAVGNLTTVTDHDGHAATFEYLDPQFVQMPSQATGPSGDVVRFTYDLHGNLETLTDFPDPMADPDGRQMTLVRNAAGDLASRVDDDGRTETFIHDEVGRLIQHVDGVQRTTDYAYRDECSCSGDGYQGVTFHDGTSVGFVYDGLGRMTQRVDQAGNQSQFFYDAEGNLNGYTNREGQSILYGHDAVGDTIRKEIVGGQVTEYEYDIRGDLVRGEDDDCLVEFDYDLIGRLETARTRLTYSFPGGIDIPLEHEIELGYDNADRRTELTSGVGVFHLDYTYDSVSRLQNLTLTEGGQGGIWTFGYDEAGRRESIDRAQVGLVSNYTYDEASQLANLTHSSSPQVSLSYGPFNGSGDAEAAQLSTAAASLSLNFTNDGERRLTNASYGITLGEQELDETYAYNSSNRLLSDSVSTYSYDLEGRLTAKVTGNRTEAFVYDVEGQLLSVTERVDLGAGPQISMEALYTYDPLGRRVQKSVNGVLTRYIYDGVDVLHVLDGQNQIEHTVIHGPEVDDVVAIRDEVAGEILEVLVDRLGTPVALADSTGAVVQEQLFDEFGVLVTQTAPDAPVPYGYTARPFDGETGLHYYRARYYDALSGRFLSEDPLDITAGLNLYSYVGANPVNFKDPTGELVWFAIPLAGAVLGGGIDIGFQLWGNGGRLDCLNYQRAGFSALLGAAGGIAGAAAKGALAARSSNAMVTVSRWGRPGLRSGDWIMKGPANRFNYIRSAKWEPKWHPWGNNPTPFRAGEVFQVPRSSIQWPKGFGIDGWFKGLFGQRKYVP